MTSWTKPAALRPGDLVGVCAPSSAVDPRALETGVAELSSLGFRVEVAPSAREKTRFTAGPAEARLRDLEAFFARPDVAGIFCARGGAGALGLLRALDPDLVRNHPKVFVGYSDSTALHLAFHRQGLVTFHGPLVAWELAAGNYDRASLLAAVMGQGAPFASEEGDLASLREGSAEGVLRGGCLSLLAAAAGTPWALSTEGEDSILFIEDVDEPPYRVDRMLVQLRESGALTGVRGIVFGDMRGCSPSVDEPYGLEEVILEALGTPAIPVALGLSSGHTKSPLVTLPLGVRARLECSEGGARFEIAEAGVL